MRMVETKRPRVTFETVREIAFEDYREAAKFLTLLSCGHFGDEEAVYDRLVSLVPGYLAWRDSDFGDGNRYVSTPVAAQVALRLLCQRYGLALAENVTDPVPTGDARPS